MKLRRHHNNKGYRQIKNGKTRKFAKRLKRLLVAGRAAKHANPHHHGTGG